MGRLAGPLAAAALAALAGCGGGPPPVTDVAAAKTGDTLYVARSSGRAPDAAGATGAPPLTPLAAQVPGFRVQVFQSLSLVEAESHARSAAQALGVPAYVEFRAPYYRVRVGDCRTRAAGDGLLGRVVRSGYPGAGLVEALVSPESAGGTTQPPAGVGS